MRKDSTENKEKIKNLPAKKPVVKWVTTKKVLLKINKAYSLTIPIKYITFKANGPRSKGRS